MTDTISEGNTAAYGPFMASVPFDLRVLDERAFTIEQTSGQLISPPISVGLIDAYGSLVRTDSDTFVTVSTGALAGQTTVRVVNGVANFTSLSLRLLPTTTAVITFSASLSLPALNDSSWRTITSRACLPGEAIDAANPMQCRTCSRQ